MKLCTLILTFTIQENEKLKGGFPSVGQKFEDRSSKNIITVIQILMNILLYERSNLNSIINYIVFINRI